MLTSIYNTFSVILIECFAKRNNWTSKMEYQSGHTRGQAESPGQINASTEERYKTSGVFIIYSQM